MDTNKEVNIPAKELLTLLGVVQLASSRGIFRPEEFADIGNAYTTVYNFLVELNVIQKPNKEVK